MDAATGSPEELNLEGSSKESNDFVDHWQRLHDGSLSLSFRGTGFGNLLIAPERYFIDVALHVLLADVMEDADLGPLNDSAVLLWTSSLAYPFSPWFTMECPSKFSAILTYAELWSLIRCAAGSTAASTKGRRAESS